MILLIFQNFIKKGTIVMKIEDFYLTTDGDDYGIEVMTKLQLFELFNKSQDKENGSTFESYIYDLIKMTILTPFNIKDKMKMTLDKIPYFYKEYVLDECEKVFMNTNMSLDEVVNKMESIKHETLENLAKIINLQQFL